MGKISRNAMRLEPWTTTTALGTSCGTEWQWSRQASPTLTMERSPMAGICSA